MSVLELVGCGSLAAGQDMWAANAQQEQHMEFCVLLFFNIISLCQLILPQNGLWEAEQIVVDLFLLPKFCPAATVFGDIL